MNPSYIDITMHSEFPWSYIIRHKQKAKQGQKLVRKCEICYHSRNKHTQRGRRQHYINEIVYF
uniref:Uncharacterized protein n=1 Tax=Rhizophora mucronata TaxID=61149 RepID=A0A2P2MZR2_RHIMU